MQYGSMFYYLYMIICKITRIVKLRSHDRRGLLVCESKGINNEDDSNLVKREELQHIKSLLGIIDDS